MRWRENKKFTGWAVFAAALLFYGMTPSSGISPRLQEKLDNAIAGTYETEAFEIAWMEVSPELSATAPVPFTGLHFFRIESPEAGVMGYGYLGEAPSQKNVFDYVILFTPDLQIKKSKVLIYREDYGRQIGSQRWLQQFNGLTPQDKAIYGETVDAISGATISASSMTRAVSNVLAGIQQMKTHLIKSK